MVNTMAVEKMTLLEYYDSMRAWPGLSLVRNSKWNLWI